MIELFLANFTILMAVYYSLYKPYQMLSQFTNEGTDKKCLKDLEYAFEKDVYPVGRLDYDSEGLLLLTNDKKVNNFLLHPENEHEREYWVQLEGEPGTAFIKQIEKGVTVSIDGKSMVTKPCKAHIFKNEPPLPPRNPPIRFRANIPTTWVALTLFEGKNRQVRKMTAACGFPVLRLVRYRIEKITIDKMLPSDIRMFEGQEYYNLLRL